MRDKSDIVVEKFRKKLVIVGEGAVGKTALLMVQSKQPYPEVYHFNLGIYSNHI
jgi:GTPase SAR1 family protein